MKRWHVQCLLDEDDYNEYLRISRILHCDDASDSYKIKRIIEFAKEKIE